MGYIHVQTYIFCIQGEDVLCLLGNHYDISQWKQWKQQAETSQVLILDSERASKLRWVLPQVLVSFGSLNSLEMQTR